MTLKILALGGDGIGPEVVDAALRVLDVASRSIDLAFDLSEDLLHGAAWDKYGCFIRPQTLDKASASDALLVGATGGPTWDHIVIDGSLGMLPSASLADLPQVGCVQGSAIYEPVHGSAPDIAGQGIANPLGMILSLAMMLEYTAGEVNCARKIEAAVDAALNTGNATRDIGGTLGTDSMADAVIEQFRTL